MRIPLSASQLVTFSVSSGRLAKRILTRIGHAATPTVLTLLIGAAATAVYGFHIKPPSGTPVAFSSPMLGLSLNVPKNQPGGISAQFTLNGNYHYDTGANSFICAISGTGLKESGLKWSLSVMLPVGTYASDDKANDINISDHNGPNSPLEFTEYTISPLVTVSSFTFEFDWVPGLDQLVSQVGASFAATFPELDVSYQPRSDDHLYKQRVVPDISVTSGFKPPDNDDVIDAGIQPSNLNVQGSGDQGPADWMWPTVQAGPVFPAAPGSSAPIYYAASGIQIRSAHSVSGQAAENAAEFSSGIFLGVAGAALIGGVQEFVNQLWDGRRRKRPSTAGKTPPPEASPPTASPEGSSASEEGQGPPGP
jgi:hypothetical protein